MNESEHNFQDVKRLLKLKRHEAPPPGYFNNFSSQVVSRIRAGEAREASSMSEKFKDSAPWLANFIRIFEAKPAFLGAGATSVCLLLVFGLVLTERTDITPGTFLTANSQSVQTFASNPTSAGSPSVSDPLASTGITLSTNPVTSLQPVATIFGQPNTASLFQPAGFNH